VFADCPNAYGPNAIAEASAIASQTHWKEKLLVEMNRMN